MSSLELPLRVAGVRLGGGLRSWSRNRRDRYLRSVRTRVSTAVDTRLADLIVALACRRWPALRLMPAGWIRPAVRPAAIRLRRALSAAALMLGVTVSLTVAAFAILT
jgi:hypothetical protein